MNLSMILALVLVACASYTESLSSENLDKLSTRESKELLELLEEREGSEMFGNLFAEETPAPTEKPDPCKHLGVKFLKKGEAEKMIAELEDARKENIVRIKDYMNNLLPTARKEMGKIQKQIDRSLAGVKKTNEAKISEEQKANKLAFVYPQLVRNYAKLGVVKEGIDLLNDSVKALFKENAKKAFDVGCYKKP
jgi:hypothetical protein